MKIKTARKIPHALRVYCTVSDELNTENISAKNSFYSKWIYTLQNHVQGAMFTVLGNISLNNCGLTNFQLTIKSVTEFVNLNKHPGWRQIPWILTWKYHWNVSKFYKHFMQNTKWCALVY